MDLALLIVLPILTAATTIASFFIARTAEARKRGTVDGALKADIQYIKEKVTGFRLTFGGVSKSRLRRARFHTTWGFCTVTVKRKPTKKLARNILQRYMSLRLRLFGIFTLSF